MVYLHIILILYHWSHCLSTLACHPSKWDTPYWDTPQGNDWKIHTVFTDKCQLLIALIIIIIAGIIGSKYMRAYITFTALVMCSSYPVIKQNIKVHLSVCLCYHRLFDAIIPSQFKVKCDKIACFDENNTFKSILIEDYR